LVEYQREGYQMYNSMIEAIKEESVQLLFHLDVSAVQAEQEAEESEKQAAEESGPSEPDVADESNDEAATAQDEDESAQAADEEHDIAESENVETEASQAPGIVGPAPISHADEKLPASKRPKNNELRSPWSDGRTFPGTPKNAPCPCGSGRKYKLCHGRNEK
jgi:preprotein translocase subunit SecA